MNAQSKKNHGPSAFSSSQNSSHHSNCNPENFANFPAQTPKSTCQDSPEIFKNSSSTFDTVTEDAIPKSASTKNELRCGYCSTTFTQKWGLRRHQENKCKYNFRKRSHTNSKETPFKCHNFGCNYKGLRVDHLQMHQRSCRGRTPTPAAAETSDEISVVAVVDKRREGAPESLKEKANMDEAEYNCSICTFKSKSRSRLKSHMINHTSHKPFSCPIEGCNFQTKWSYNVKIHCKLIHRMESPPKTPLQTEENFGPVMDSQTETGVDAMNSCSTMAFACTLCDFIGDSELAALEHAHQHTAAYVALGPVL